MRLFCLPRRRLMALAALCCGSLFFSAHANINDRAFFKVAGIVIVWGADATGQVPLVSDFVIDTGNGTSAAASGDTDLISSDVHTVLTGTLSPTEDAFAGGSMPFVITDTSAGDIITDTSGDGRLTADDSFTALGLEGLTDARVDTTKQYTSFYVASNTPFAIDAQVFPPGTLLDFILLIITRMELSVTPSGIDGGITFGSQSQAPHSGGGQSGFSPERTLWSLRTPQNIFTGDQRTAAGAGSIVNQSVRFDAEYTIRAQNLAGYDLSLGTFDFQVEVVYTVFVP